MKRLLGWPVLLCAVALAGRAQDSPFPPPEPENLSNVIDRLVRYHDFGQYDSDIRVVANRARASVEARVRQSHPGEKLAAVFDIDETALSNWDAMQNCGFCSYKVQEKLYPSLHDPAIVPVRELYDFLKSKGVAVFFLTGRSESQRAETAANLQEAGYRGWTDLLMRPDRNHDPARIFKPSKREEISHKGYTIILNMGDQASDLAGCCAEEVFKLPNPFYLVP